MPLHIAVCARFTCKPSTVIIQTHEIGEIIFLTNHQAKPCFTWIITRTECSGQCHAGQVIENIKRFFNLLAGYDATNDMLQRRLKQLLAVTLITQSFKLTKAPFHHSKSHYAVLNFLCWQKHTRQKQPALAVINRQQVRNFFQIGKTKAAAPLLVTD